MSLSESALTPTRFKELQMNANNTPGPERLLKLPEVESLTALRRSSIYNGVKAKTFPSPVRLGPRAIAWREQDIASWLASRVPVVA